MSKDKTNTKKKQDMPANPPFRVGEKVGRHVGPCVKPGEKVGMHVDLQAGEKENAFSMHLEAPPIVFQRAKELRERETESEQLLWEELKGKKLGGYKFRRQHPVMKYVLDFYCHQCKLAVELDGEYHDTMEQKELDKLRTKHMNDFGIEVIRFSNGAVERNIEKVKNEILEVIKTKMQELT
jgi:very-short-patch-repair endonuclease